MGFSEKLAAAKAASRKFEDVDVLLDTDLSDLRAELQASLDDVKRRNEGDQRLSAGVDPEESAIQGKLDELIAQSRDSIITLRFFRLPGDSWADIMSRCPARFGAPLDEYYGYNMQQATKLAAPFADAQGQIYAGRVVGDEVIPLRYEPKNGDDPGINEWADLFSVISGVEQTRIESAVWIVNVKDPETDMYALKKKLGLPLD